MTTRLPVFSALLIIFLAIPLAAQVDFGLQPYCESPKNYPAKSLPSQVLRTLVTEAGNGADPAQFCLGDGAAAEAHGFEADLNSDQQAELILVQHSGPGDTGCNALFILREESNKTYKLLDMFQVAPGTATTLPIRLLPNGMQIYSQSSYKKEDGSMETKGAFFTFEKEALLVLISWVTKDGTVNGARTVTTAQGALADVDYHGVKEFFLKISTYQPGDGKPDDKNLTDRFVLTLQFLATQYRYVLYDSSGFDKITRAKDMTSVGARLLYSEKTAEDGVMKLKEAIAMDPFSTDARVTLGRYYLRTGKISDAERSFSQAIEMDPMAPDPYKYLGDTYIKINDLQKTLDNYRKFLELHPDGREAKRVKAIIKQITVPKARR